MYVKTNSSTLLPQKKYCVHGPLCRDTTSVANFVIEYFFYVHMSLLDCSRIYSNYFNDLSCFFHLGCTQLHLHVSLVWPLNSSFV